jgi:murein DD-endopeptidase MepM/ murein hydrolase activator NlpD
VAGKFYTIMIIPHTRGKYRNLRFSRRLVHGGAVAAAVLLLSAFLLPRYLWISHSQARDLEVLTSENLTLREANENYDRDVSELRSRLANYERQATKFALMAGVTDLPASDLPAGSPGELPADFSPNSLRPGYLEEEIDILKTRARTLDRSYEALGEAYADQAVRLASTPSISPTRGLMGSGFGHRNDPFTGKRQMHPGLDIVANAGTPVYATADGVVTRSGRMSSYGKAVFVSHGNGYASRYAHLSEVTVKAGQKVKRGDLIGKVGATGRAMGFHLHYEVLQHDRKVDPMKHILDVNRIL